MVCQVVNKTTDPRGEYVHVANDGPAAALLTGREVTDITETQQHFHVYTFPDAVGGDDLFVWPGHSAFVFTGLGTNTADDNGNYLLFAGRRASIWNNDGDVAYLREANGRFIDWRTVGDSAQRPNGH